MKKTICASEISWMNGKGTAKCTDLFGDYLPPDRFIINSPVTGTEKEFYLDSQEDSDGEYWLFLATEGPYSIQVWNL